MGSDSEDILETSRCLDGRDILGRSTLARKGFSDADLDQAELFTVGFRWKIERALDWCKAADWENLLPDPGIIRRLTRLQEWVNFWSNYEATKFMRRLRRSFVRN